MIRGYFNQKADIWDETIAEKDTAKLKLMAERLNIEPGSRLLDVGTGTGVFIPFLLSIIGENGQITAIDIAEEMLEKARAKGFKGNIDFLHASIAETPFDDEAFNAAVCYSTFPHFQDKPKALKEIHRVTKRGGKLLICHTSSRAQINQIHREIPDVKNDIIPDESEMRVMLQEAGFTDITIDDNSVSYLCAARKPD